MFIPVNNSNTTGFRTQSFSGTDLNTKKGSYGIVFPLEEVKDYTPSFSSIVTHSGQRTICSHSECRLVLVKDNIEYIKGDCIAYIKAEPKEHKVSAVRRLFTKEIPYTENRSYLASELDVNTQEGLIKEIIDFWDSLDFKAETDMVEATNLTKKTYVQQTFGNYASKFWDYETSYYSKQININGIKVDLLPQKSLPTKQAKQNHLQTLLKFLKKFKIGIVLTSDVNKNVKTASKEIIALDKTESDKIIAEGTWDYYTDTTPYKLNINGATIDLESYFTIEAPTTTKQFLYEYAKRLENFREIYIQDDYPTYSYLNLEKATKHDLRLHIDDLTDELLKIEETIDLENNYYDDDNYWYH